MQKITIVAKFPGTKNEYHYLAPDGDEPMIGDAIVTSMSTGLHEEDEDDVHLLAPPIVDVTPSSGRGLPTPWSARKSPLVEHYESFKLATIVNILPAVTLKATKSYLMLMPRALLANRIAGNRAFLKRVEERKMAERRLRALVEERNNRDVYEKLAKENPEAAELIKLLDEPI